MSTPAGPRSGRDAIAQFLPQSPFAAKLGIVAELLDDDQVCLRLPLAPARSTDVIGVGRVLRRGRSLVNCEAEIVDPQGTLIAKAIATYKIG